MLWQIFQTKVLVSNLTKFKGRLNMKQYIKSKPIKLGLKSSFFLTLKPGVPIARLVGLKITHLSCTLNVIFLCAFRRRETIFCFITNTQTNGQTILTEDLNI